MEFKLLLLYGCGEDRNKTLNMYKKDKGALSVFDEYSKACGRFTVGGLGSGNTHDISK